MKDRIHFIPITFSFSKPKALIIEETEGFNTMSRVYDPKAKTIRDNKGIELPFYCGDTYNDLADAICDYAFKDVTLTDTYIRISAMMFKLIQAPELTDEDLKWWRKEIEDNRLKEKRAIYATREERVASMAALRLEETFTVEDIRESIKEINRINLQDKPQKWWGYRHDDGTLYLYRHFDTTQTIHDACLKQDTAAVAGPFEATDRTHALKILKSRLKV